MPTNSESHRESDRDRAEERRGSKQNSASFKSKDLSHVPCKFQKSGRCAAGSSCLFSHNHNNVKAEPQKARVRKQKQPCRYFIKGNCKFGQKCVFAHVLSGQSMSMDKKTSQSTASGASEKDVEPGSDGDTRREATFFPTVAAELLHLRNRMRVDSGAGWGEFKEKQEEENVHSALDILPDVEHPHPPHAHLLSSSRSLPDLRQSKNYILPTSMGKFNDPTLSLVNADTLNTDKRIPSDEAPPTRFGIPIPPRKIRFRDDLEDDPYLLQYIIRENLRSRRRLINSASTAGSRPSPMISGASDPFTPD